MQVQHQPARVHTYARSHRWDPEVPHLWVPWELQSRLWQLIDHMLYLLPVRNVLRGRARGCTRYQHVYMYAWTMWWISGWLTQAGWYMTGCF